MGKKAYAVLLYNNKEISDLKAQGNIRFPPPETIKIIYTALMNHLQVAAGSGEGRNMDFDIAVFANAFKQDILMVTYAIKALEQEGILTYNEIFFKPSTVIFTTDKHSLEEYEEQHPQLEPLIKGLLRSYEAIFDYPVTVYETTLAKFLRTNVELIKQGLNELHRYGIINYSAQKDSPQLILLQNRMYADSFAIKTAEYLQRKKHFEDRVNVMIDYIQDPQGAVARPSPYILMRPLQKPAASATIVSMKRHS